MSPVFNSNLAKNYFKHIVQGKNEHSLHSPFLFEFYTKAIKGKSASIPEIESVRNEYLHSNQVLEVTDFGAGSKVSKTSKRTISAIAKSALTPKNQCTLLLRILDYLNVHTIVELGTSLGISAAYFAHTNERKCTVDTIEGCPNIASIAENTFQSINLTNVRQHVGNINVLLPELISSLTKVDAVFLDGNHTKEATLRYFDVCKPAVHNDTVFIFDDIYWSKGMEEAWNEIISKDEVTLSIDLFDFGLVFFRDNQPKQHFKLKR